MIDNSDWKIEVVEIASTYLIYRGDDPGGEFSPPQGRVYTSISLYGKKKQQERKGDCES